jgi:hypothetical protein
VPPPNPAQPRPGDGQLELQRRIDAIAQKALDAAEGMIAKMAASPSDQPAVAVVRRQVANRFKVWEVCANQTCRRSHCCRGEPLNCLRYGLPAMPNALAGLLKMRPPRRRAR